MPPATLPQIEVALLARLRTRLASATEGGEFRRIDRWPGTWSQEAEIDQAAVGIMPAAFLADDGSMAEGPNGELAESILDEGETVPRHAFVVLTLVQDARPDAARSVQGTEGQSGILGCDQAVMEVLTGLRIPNVYRGEGVRFAGRRPWKAQRGKYIAHLVRFTVRTGLDTTATESVDLPEVDPLEQMTGRNGPDGFDDLAPDLAPSTIDFTDDS